MKTQLSEKISFYLDKNGRFSKELSERRRNELKQKRKWKTFTRGIISEIFQLKRLRDQIGDEKE
jgi:hypothetical protein